jgi:HSP20 family protein
MAFPTRWPFSEERFGFQDELWRALAAPLLEGTTLASRAGVFPPVNVYDDGEKFLVRAELPGVDKDSLEITAQGDQLTLRGERKIEAAEKKASYHRREREGGQFRRVVSLPQAVDADHITATYKNGVLEIELPWAPELKPRRISIH